MTLYGNRIAGKIHNDGPVFESDPVTGERSSFTAGTTEMVEQAAKAAADAFRSYGRTTRAERAEFLRTIAAEIESRGPAITAMGVAETGLPAARLEGERGRTTGQLKLFAEHIEKADYLDLRHDAALPDRAPAPRPDLRLMQRPLGPVAVFGASNFPLAFSTAGGDTASALAAGCPVVVKGHPGHPGTAAIVGEAIDAAVAALVDVPEASMLTTGIASAYRSGVKTLRSHSEVRVVQASEAEGRFAAPVILAVDAADFISNPDLAHEVFGPAGIIVSTSSDDQMLSIARSLEGQLTTTLQLDEADQALAAELLPELEEISGRILCNGFPTGVEVADSMMHGGPYPASTSPSATSVGTLAIRRFLRPVSYQNFPAELLPADLSV